MNIIIIGGGWYGCYIAYVLQHKHNVTILEQCDNLFTGASYYNQNRLHIGYHYPRNFKTRKLCIDGYSQFLNMFSDLTENIDNNYYIIAKDSIMDYQTYAKIFQDYHKTHHYIIPNTMFGNIDGDIIVTNEKYINPEKSRIFFSENLKCDLIFNFKVESIKNKNNKVIINDQIEADIVIDCTYNKLGLVKELIFYEKTISLLYKRTHKMSDFDAITVMDGEFVSLFPRTLSSNIYTLTHVKYTPLIKTSNLDELNNYLITADKVNFIKQKMEHDIKLYIPTFSMEFEYDGYFISNKCKPISVSDSRECFVIENSQIITIICGKITGIFDAEKSINKILSKYTCN